MNKILSYRNFFKEGSTYIYSNGTRLIQNLDHWTVEHKVRTFAIAKKIIFSVDSWFHETMKTEQLSCYFEVLDTKKNVPSFFYNHILDLIVWLSFEKKESSVAPVRSSHTFFHTWTCATDFGHPHFRMQSRTNFHTRTCARTLEPSCCKKRQKKSQPRNWFEEQGVSKDSEWYQISPKFAWVTP